MATPGAIRELFARVHVVAVNVRALPGTATGGGQAGTDAYPSMPMHAQMCAPVCWDGVADGVPSNITRLVLVPATPAMAHPWSCCPPETLASTSMC